jgi:hypothetical protein
MVLRIPEQIVELQGYRISEFQGYSWQSSKLKAQSSKVQGFRKATGSWQLACGRQVGKEK